jgi:hypothetical protein
MMEWYENPTASEIIGALADRLWQGSLLLAVARRLPGPDSHATLKAWSRVVETHPQPPVQVRGAALHLLELFREAAGQSWLELANVGRTSPGAAAMIVLEYAPGLDLGDVGALADLAVLDVV